MSCRLSSRFKGAFGSPMRSPLLNAKLCHEILDDTTLKSIPLPQQIHRFQSVYEFLTTGGLSKEVSIAGPKGKMFVDEFAVSRDKFQQVFDVIPKLALVDKLAGEAVVDSIFDPPKTDGLQKSDLSDINVDFIYGRLKNAVRHPHAELTSCLQVLGSALADMEQQIEIAITKRGIHKTVGDVVESVPPAAIPKINY